MGMNGHEEASVDNKTESYKKHKIKRNFNREWDQAVFSVRNMGSEI
jgi:hypothetical protein